jgi:hypothetical protein
VSLTLDTQTPSPSGRGGGVLAEIADAVRTLDGGFLVGDRFVAVRGARGCAVQALTGALHRRWFLGQDLADGGPAVEDVRFVRRVRDLLGRRYYWEPGWEVVERTDDGRWLVVQDDLVLTVAHDEINGTRGRVKVRFPAERPRSNPGWLTVTGLRGPALPTGPLASCYLHLRTGSAATLFTDLVRYLDTLGLRFTARLLADPSSYGRPDSVVVTAPRVAIPSVLRMALGLHPRARDGFGDAVPAFTRAMAAGIALADEPPSGHGFGIARCRVIATGLVAAGPDAGPEERLAVVHRTLASEGLHPAALHLEPGHAEFSLPQW